MPFPRFNKAPCTDDKICKKTIDTGGIVAIRIIVDSSADMEEDYAAEHDITIIPITITFGSEQG